MKKTPPAPTPPTRILPDSIPGKTGLIAPNSLLRCALFSAAGGKKELLQRAKIEGPAGAALTYTGPRLGQPDLDIWYALLNIDISDDGWREFSTRAILKMMGRTCGKSDREWLTLGVARLSATNLEVRPDALRVTYGGSLVDEFIRNDEHEGWWRVRLNPRLADLFSHNEWTIIDKSVRGALARKPLAQWLHAFYSTHHAPFPYSAAALMKLSGAGGGETHRFRTLLRPALAEVQQETGWRCALTKNDMVTIKKSSKKLADTPGECRLENLDDLEDMGAPGTAEPVFKPAFEPISTPDSAWRAGPVEDDLGVFYLPGNVRDVRILAEIYSDFDKEDIIEAVAFLRMDPHGGTGFYDEKGEIKQRPFNKGIAWASAVLLQLEQQVMDEMPTAQEMADIHARAKAKKGEADRSKLISAAAEIGITLK